MGQSCCTQANAGTVATLQHNLVREQKRDYHDVYRVVGLIGEGSISNIYKIRKKESSRGGSAHKFRPKVRSRRDLTTHKGEVYAMKEFDLDFVMGGYVDELRNEIDLLKELDHPNIIKLYETFLWKKKLSIVIELCTGGDLYKRHPYSEIQAAELVQQVLSAVNYMHKRHVIHRDLKYENIMFENDNPRANVKVIDFGLAAVYRDRPLTDRVGTVYTMSPQVLEGYYSAKADLWSVGVIAYMLMSGVKPFWGSSKKAIIRAIRRGTYSFDTDVWKDRSQSGKDFITSLLQKDPKKRLNAAQALQHPWLANKAGLSDRVPDLTAMECAQLRLVQYAESGEFKRLVLNVVAKKSTTEDIMLIRDLFNEFDKNRDGTISYAEFREALSHSNVVPDEEMQIIFDKMDVNKNNRIMYTEFVASVLEMRGKIEEAKIADAFDQLDSDDSGYITKANLRKILGSTGSPEYVDCLIKEVDLNRDGRISYEEFKHYFAEKHAENVRLAREDDAFF